METTSQKIIILVPYPAQGHVTPMLRLALAFLNLGFRPVLVTPESVHRKIVSSVGGLQTRHKEVSFLSVPDNRAGRDHVPGDFFGIEDVIENSLPFHLERLVHDLDEDGGVACLVVDLLVSSAVEVAHRCGVPVAGFWPAMLATYKLIAAIPHMVEAGLISDTGSPLHRDPICILPNQPAISMEDLPWLIGTPAAREGRFRFWKKVISRSKSLCWLLVNSFPEEEFDTGKPHRNALIEDPFGQPRIFQVGGLINGSLMDKNPSFLEEDPGCLEWLDIQEPSSVIYISFGSWASPAGDGRVRDLALALEATGQPFIWALGSGWRKELPEGFETRVSKQGKVVSWAPQLEVLQHRAVGSYLTHCGWNSTLEAIQSQKRLLCYPIAGDQLVNCAYIVDEWRVGVRIGNGFGKQDFERSLRKVTEDDQIGVRLKKLHERTIGGEARLLAMAKLRAFVDDIVRNQVHD